LNSTLASRAGGLALSSLLFALTACNDGHSARGRKIGGMANFGGLAADPERPWVCAADSVSGRLVVVDASDGAVQHDFMAQGGSVGGVHYDSCTDSLFVSVTGRARLEVYDPLTLTRRSSLRIKTPSYAVAEAANHRLLLVTDLGLVEFDPAALKRTTVFPGLATDALLATDRDARFSYAAETVGGSTIVRRFDLLDLAAPPLDNLAAPMPGRVVGLAVDFDGARLFVATDLAPGIRILDSTTLAEIGTVDVGDGLVSIALSTTGLRLFFASTAPLIESVIVLPRYVGPQVPLAAVPRERGICLSTNNEDLTTWDDAGALTSYGIFPFAIRAPTALHMDESGTMTLQGRPNAYYLLFLSGGVAPLILDRKATVDPRMLELALGLGFQLVFNGQLDANGQATITDIVPPNLTDELDTVWQAAQTDSLVKPKYELSNALVIRLHGPDCP